MALLNLDEYSKTKNFISKINIKKEPLFVGSNKTEELLDTSLVTDTMTNFHVSNHAIISVSAIDTLMPTIPQHDKKFIKSQKYLEINSKNNEINRDIRAITFNSINVRPKSSVQIKDTLVNIVFNKEILRILKPKDSIIKSKPLILINKVQTKKAVLKVLKSKDVPINEINSDLIIIDTNNKISNGLDSLTIEVTAGRECNIVLREFDSKINIKSISYIPSSLYFNKEESAIKGVPFILGDHSVDVTLDSNSIVKVVIRVIPEGYSSSL